MYASNRYILNIFWKLNCSLHIFFVTDAGYIFLESFFPLLFPYTGSPCSPGVSRYGLYPKCVLVFSPRYSIVSYFCKLSSIWILKLAFLSLNFLVIKKFWKIVLKVILMNSNWSQLLCGVMLDSLKNRAQSFQPFWCLLVTIQQTDKLNIYRLNYLTH